MKYDTVTKRDRNTEIVFLHKFQPEMSMKEIGERYGITAQRVSAILARALKARAIIKKSFTNTITENK